APQTVRRRLRGAYPRATSALTTCPFAGAFESRMRVSLRARPLPLRALQPARPGSPPCAREETGRHEPDHQDPGELDRRGSVDDERNTEDHEQREAEGEPGPCEQQEHCAANRRPD